MKLPRYLDRRLGFALGAVGVLLGTVAPAVFPTFASAAQVSNRSITLSSSIANDTNVSYDIKFGPATTGAGYVTILFCSNSPLVGDSCTAPSSLSVSSATIGAGSTGSASIDHTANANTIVVKTSLVTNTELILNAVHNPSTANQTFYARLETFASGVDATDQTNAEGAETATATTGMTDWGGVAMSTTNTIGVTAYVQESMTFCVSGFNGGTAPDHDCSGNVVSPSVTLGTATGPETILGSSLSTAQDWAQLSTNAANGAVVNLKSDALSCGGLYLAFNNTCGIPPQTTSGNIAAGAGKFGINIGTSSAASGGTASGTFQAANSSYTGASTYYMHYVSGDATGVTSTYGDAFLNTNSLPAAENNIPFTLAADAAPTTPAGKYVANLNLIAVGTF